MRCLVLTPRSSPFVSVSASVSLWFFLLSFRWLGVLITLVSASPSATTPFWIVIPPFSSFSWSLLLGKTQR